MKKRYFDIFIDIITRSFLGEQFEYFEKNYKLKPTIVNPYDFLRKIENPSSEYEQLLYDLKNDFKENAKTEIYRKDRGWITQGVSQRKIKIININGR